MSDAVTRRPIRVVLFTGPFLEHGTLRFACMLDEHPDVELIATFCESPGRGWCARAADLWRRRRLLAPLVGAAELTGGIWRAAAAPRAALALRRRAARVLPRVRFVTDLHAQEVVAAIGALLPDLGLIYGGPILRPHLFELPRLGTLGIHHGRVPQYRGKKTTFWAMYNGEPSVGVTIQRVNAGVDTGSIVGTGEVSAVGRSYRAVWNELEELGLRLYLQAVLDVAQGTATCLPQEGPRGPLYRDPRPKHLLRYFWTRAKGTVVGAAMRSAR